MTAEGTLEAVLSPDVALYDVTRDLPVHPAKKYGRRDTEEISRIFVHKSGADGPAGFKGMFGCARYFVASYGRSGGPGFPYTYWLSREPDKDSDGRLCVYRGNEDETWSWHTGKGNNRIGVAIGVQGNYDGDGGAVEREPTAEQWTMLEALARHLGDRHGITLQGWEDDDQDGVREYNLSGHWENGKPVCPGDALKAWVLKTRGQASARNVADASDLEVKPRGFDAKERQVALLICGFNPGPVDGKWGYQSRAALERFQHAHNLAPDGVWGKQTSAAMLSALRKQGRADRDKFEAYPVSG